MESTRMQMASNGCKRIVEPFYTWPLKSIKKSHTKENLLMCLQLVSSCLLWRLALIHLLAQQQQTRNSTNALYSRDSICSGTTTSTMYQIAKNSRMKASRNCSSAWSLSNQMRDQQSRTQLSTNGYRGKLHLRRKLKQSSNNVMKGSKQSSWLNKLPNCRVFRISMAHRMRRWTKKIQFIEQRKKKNW